MFSRQILYPFVCCTLLLSGCQSVTEKSADNQATQLQQSTPLITANVSQKPAHTTQKTEENLWVLNRKLMQLDLHLENPRVQKQLNWYKKHPQYMSRVVERARPYYYHILHEAIQRDMPVELALLPVVESAFDPFAYSHGRAAGTWQFIPSTGKYFGLKQTWWFDGRRDIIHSTDAAYGYLKKLNKRFEGDWLLALAAYNAGGGTVSLAIKRNKRVNKATDYWSLKLPKETMAYVPKLLAVAELFKHPKKYGLDIPHIANTPYFEQVDTESQIDLAQAAAMSGMTTKALYQLNPGFNRWATDPEGPHRLLIPVEKADKFRQALAKLPPSERIRWTRYKIRSGDSLIGIAKKFGTTPELIRTTNKLKGNNIRAGKTLLVATASKGASEYVLSQNQRQLDKQKTISRTTNREQKFHKVRSGDSFWSIAKKYQVGVRQLARWNSMAPGDPLLVGKRLVIWSTPETTTLSATDRQIMRKVGYKVRNGDSLSQIASKFKVQVADILRWNKLDKQKYLRLGQRLTLYVDVTRSY